MFVVTIVMIVVCAYLNAWAHTGHNRYTKFIYTETKPFTRDMTEIPMWL